MQISSTIPSVTRNAPVAPQAKNVASDTEGSSFGDSVKDFYQQNKTAIHLGGGALLGAGIAMYGGGLNGSAVVSAAGSGALGGFFAGDDSQKALYMGGGALIGATIASMAGVPGTAVVSAAGTGALVGFLFG